jgi:3-hydroxyisobutyrate dehydrogenase
MTVKIGYVGLGAMGGALARWLVDRYSLVVWDMNRGAIDDLVAAGATTVATLTELARQCDIVFLCLPRSSDVASVLFDPGGLADGMSAGKIVVDQTSGLPAKTAEFARRLALSGIGMIDAPVAGGVPAALAGSITVMVSGPDAYVETASPVLAAISPKVFRCSDRVGDGQAAKLVNNSINSGYRMATLELVAMGSKLGLPLAVMTDALNMGWGGNFTALRLLTSLVQGQPSTNFAMSLMLKDLDQCIALGMEAGAPMPVTTIARGLMQIALNMQGATAGLDEVVPAVEAMYGASLHQPTPSVRADGTLSSVPPGGRYGLAGAPPFDGCRHGQSSHQVAVRFSRCRLRRKR